MRSTEKRREFCGYGTTFTAKRWFTWNPGGIAGLAFSYFIHIYALLVLFHHVVLPLSTPSMMTTLWSNILFYIVYLPFALLAIISLFVASTTNPGAVPMGAKPFTKVRRIASSDADGNVSTRKVTSTPSSDAISRCYKCQENYKPSRAHHDSVTDRCIVKFDHYCPWINNAVGALNHKFFCLFLLYTMLSCLISGLLLLLRYRQCFALLQNQEHPYSISVHPHSGTNGIADDETTKELVYHTEGDRWLSLLYNDTAESASPLLVHACTGEFWKNYHILLLLCVSVLFFFFTLVMGYEQLEAIETGKGKIARMKQSVGHQGTEFSKVTEEFNEMFGGSTPHVAWHWFLPISLRFPRGMQQVVLGYEFNDSCNPNVPYQPNNVNTATNADSMGDDHSNNITDVELGALNTKDALSSSQEDREDEADGIVKSSLPLLHKSSLSREVSTDSQASSKVKNRKGYRNADSPLNSSNHLEDVSLVERTKARLT
jgi:DHHC palmitoyltransferase